MPDNAEKVYWDSCVFISYIEATPGRIETLDALLDQASRDEGLEIWTSTFTIAEVAFAESERSASELSDEVLAKIDGLWTGSPINLVEFNSLVARYARRITRSAMIRHQRERAPSVRPDDAVHLATAEWIKATSFHTYDAKLLKLSNSFPFTIIELFSARPPLFY